MFKLKLTNKKTYGEVAQPNPIRWRILLRNGDNMTDQSGKFKCKDFFNDVLAYYHTKTSFNMYSFENNVEFNTEGLYVLLTEIEDNPRFIKNICDGINQRLQKELGVQLSLFEQKKGSIILLIPHALFKNTYLISLVTLLIRVCNNDITFSCWEDFFLEDSPLLTIETSILKDSKLFVKTQGFITPKAGEDCWFYATWGISSKTIDGKVSSNSGVIHNNGIASWYSATINS